METVKGLTVIYRAVSGIQGSRRCRARHLRQACISQTKGQRKTKVKASNKVKGRETAIHFLTHALETYTEKKVSICKQEGYDCR